MWACLFLALLFCTAALSSLPHPTNVTFTSVNLRNIVQWSPGKGTPADTKYRVRYAIYGDSKEKRVHWRPVLHCTETTRTWCDLSEETSDLEHGYFAKVRAVSRKNNSEWVLTHRRFDPKIDTEFGPPHVSVELDDKYAVVTIEGPMRYFPNNDTPQVSMATLYPHMIYNLSIHNTRSGRIRHFLLTSNKYKYDTMDHGTELCFSATTKLKHMPSKHHSSAWHCITTPKAPLIDRLERIVIVSTAVPAVLLCLLAVGSYILYKYLLGTDQKSPVSLVQEMPPFLPPPLPVVSESINIIVIPVHKDDGLINKLYPKLPNPSRTSQRHEPQPFVDVSCNQQDDYAFVSRSDDVGQCNVTNPSYNPKEWQAVAKSSGSTYASQNSFLQSSSSSSMNPVLLNQSREDLCETGSSNDNEGEIVVSSGYATQNVRPAQPSNQLHDLPDDYGFVTSTGYASQNVRSLQPVNQSELLPDNYKTLELAAAPEVENSSGLQIDWSPSTQRLVIPGLDLGMGHEGVGSPPRSRVHLETVFVRQPSEEDALLGAERGGSGQWDAEEFMAKYDLVLSND